MTTLGEYWLLREAACKDFLASMKTAIRVSTFHELDQDAVKTIFKNDEKQAFLALYSDRIGTLVGDEFEIRETVDPDVVVHCYRGIRIRHPKGQALTDKDLIPTKEEGLDIQIEIFSESDTGPTDLLISNGKIAIIIGMNEWCMYIARKTWEGFTENYLNESLANSYEHTNGTVA